jgi:CheY-like chemotaxis protein
MLKNGPIVVIEDDADDRFMLDIIFRKLGCTNEIKFFSDGEQALEYLARPDVTPFLILSDINMPRMTGFEIRERVLRDDKMKAKCIPYLFFTTGGNAKYICEAYDYSIQGFFQKPNSTLELEQMIKSIVDYWSFCISPGQHT